MSKITLIAAMTPTRVIGLHNQLPWHLPADLAHFKAMTLHKPILMGRHTFEAIGRPLPLRDNWIISTTLTEAPQGIHLAASLSSAVTNLVHEPELMIIGGGQLYQAALAIADCLCLTMVEADMVGDTYFPSWSPAIWQLVEETVRPADTQNPYVLRFQTWQRFISK